MIPTRRPKTCEWMIHAVAWGIFLGLPFFFTGRHGNEPTWESYLRFIVGPLSFMLVFYVNYGLLVDRYLFARKPLRFLLINLLLIVAVMLTVHLLMQYVIDPAMAALRIGEAVPERRPGPPRRGSFFFFFGNSIFYLLSAGLGVAIKMTQQWYRSQAALQEAERSRAEAELKNLKSQLNPHFLFNTLNNIYALIALSPGRAQEAVLELSRLLRYVLYENNAPFVPLGQELDFVRNYVGLMRIRLPEHVTLSTRIACADPETPVAPLLFISLIENAFKHGVSDNEPSFIELDIAQQGNRICCTLRNSCFPKSAGRDKSGSGIGLVNLQRRLQLLYPDRHLFSYGPREKAYVAILQIEIPE